MFYTTTHSLLLYTTIHSELLYTAVHCFGVQNCTFCTVVHLTYWVLVGAGPGNLGTIGLGVGLDNMNINFKSASGTAFLDRVVFKTSEYFKNSPVQHSGPEADGVPCLGLEEYCPPPGGLNEAAGAVYPDRAPGELLPVEVEVGQVEVLRVCCRLEAVAHSPGAGHRHYENF